MRRPPGKGSTGFSWINIKLKLTAEWCDDCEECGESSGLRACCGYCNHVFHPTCLDPPQLVENWDETAFACGLCVTDAMAKVANTTQSARLMRQMRQATFMFM